MSFCEDEDAELEENDGLEEDEREYIAMIVEGVDVTQYGHHDLEAYIRNQMRRSR